MKRIMTLCSASLFLTLVARADCSNVACQNEVIEGLFVASSSVLIEMSGDKALLDCDLVAAKYIRLTSSHVKYDQIYALLLATQTADRRLAVIRIDSTEQSCVVDYVFQRRYNIQN